MTLVVENFSFAASAIVNGKICRIIYVILQHHKGEISRHGEREGIVEFIAVINA